MGTGGGGVCGIGVMTVVLQSIGVLIREDRGSEVMQGFQVAQVLKEVINIIKWYENKAAGDMLVREMFDTKIKGIQLNFEVIVK